MPIVSWPLREAMRRHHLVHQTAQRRRRDFFRPIGEQLEPRRMLDSTAWASGQSNDFDWFASARDETAWTTSSHDASTDGRWIVRLKDSVLAAATSFSEIARLLELPTNASVVRGLGKPGLLLVQGSVEQRQTLEAGLRSNPNVAYVERDARIEIQQTPNDPFFNQQYSLLNTGQTGGTAGADMGASIAWDTTTGSRDVVVAILDTGIDLEHPDLIDNLWTNPGESGLDVHGNDKRFNGVDDDNNGFMDDVHGYDFVNGRFDAIRDAWMAAPPTDDNGHGTHVAGIIGAAGNNGVGISGVAWETSLLPLKFLSATNDGFIGDAVRAIEYAITLKRDRGVNIRVLNNSWVSKEGHSAALQEAIEDAAEQDILIVASAGNGNAFRRGNNNDLEPVFPASYTSDHILAVAASDDRGNLVPYYNFGPTSVDLAAPGVDIYSTVVGGGYDYRSGTSMAAPHVAGVAALIFSKSKPDITALEVREAITRGVQLLPAEFERELVASQGILDARQALTLDTYRPRSLLFTFEPRIDIAGGTAYSATVRYSDNGPIDLQSIDGNDVLLRRKSDGSQFTGIADDVNVEEDGRVVTVRYLISAPEGAWDNADNGDYELLLAENEVSDLANDPNSAIGERLADVVVDVLDFGQFRVNTSADTVDVNPGDGFARDAFGQVSLRAAIMEANALSGESTIFLDATTYSLGLAGADEDLGLTGDLDIRDNVTIVGQGAGPDVEAVDLGNGRIQLSGKSDLMASSSDPIFHSSSDSEGLTLEFSIFDVMQLSNGSVIQDGERFTLSFGGVDKTFEFDADAVEDDIAADVIAIRFSPLDSDILIAAKVQRLIAEVLPNLPTALENARIRFEKAITRDTTQAPHVQFVSSFTAATLLDGRTFTLSSADSSMTFELDHDGSIMPGNAPIPFTPTSTNEEVIAGIVTSINENYAAHISGNTYIDGNRLDRVFDVHANSNLTLQNLVVRNGRVEGDGGGIRNEGTLDLDDVRVQKNESTAIRDGEFLAAAGVVGKSEARAVGRDDDGNIFIAGWFENELKLAGDDGEFTLLSHGERDIFVAKLSPTGKTQWARSFGSDYDDEAYSLEIDPNGDIVVTGFFQLTVDFSTDDVLAWHLSSAGEEDAFMLRLDSNGQRVAVNRFGGDGRDAFMSSTMDSSGDIYFAGFAGRNPGYDYPVLVHGQDPAAMVVKVDASLHPKWAAPFHGTNAFFPPDIAYGIDVDSQKNVYVTGAFSETVDFDPQSTGFELESSGESDLFLAKLDLSGALVWAKSIGGEADEVGGDVRVADDDSVYVTGGFESSDLDFDPGPGSSTLQGNSPHARTFVTRFNADGELQWARELGAHPSVSTTFASVPGQNTRIQSDDSGNVYVADRFIVFTPSTIDLSTGDDRIPESRNGFYVHKFDPTGVTIASFVTSDAESPIVGSAGLFVSPSGTVVLTGGIWGQSFDDGNVDMNPNDAEVTPVLSTAQPSAFMSAFQLPSTFASARGAGIFSTGSLQIAHTEISENRANSFGGLSVGGGIYASGEAAILDSLIEFNLGANGGGAYFSNAAAQIARTVWKSNEAANAGGALVASFSILDLVEVDLSKNEAVTGGALYSRESTVSLSRSGLAENVGRVAWRDDAGVLRIESSTIRDHRGTAVEATDSTTTVVNSTVTRNIQGLHLSASSVVKNSTVVDNFTGVASAAVKNSIVADNWHDVLSFATSLGGNIIGYASGGFVDGANGDRVGDRSGTVTGINFSESPIRFTSAGHGLQDGDVILGISDTGEDVVGEVIVYDSDRFSLEFDVVIDRWMTQLDPMLGPLVDEGSLTPTYIPLAGSPAIDHAMPDEEVLVDQRGVVRPVDGDGSGSAEPDAGAAEVAHGTAIGVVFADFNSNGLFDPEDHILTDWLVYADLNGNGQFDSDEPSTFSIGFDSEPLLNPFVWLGLGEFYFDSLPPGEYSLRAVPENNWVISSPEDGGFEISIEPGQNFAFAMLGFFPESGSISGQKYHDLDGDGKRDEGDVGLAGWRIYLDVNYNGQFDEGEPFDISDENGDYTITYDFETLEADDYPLREEPQQGWRQITPSASVVAADHDFTTDDGQPDSSMFLEITFDDQGNRGRWHLTTTNADEPSPDHSYYFGLDESAESDGYVLGNARGTLLSTPIDLRNVSGTLQLTFDSMLDVDTFKDLAQVAVLHGDEVTVLAHSFNGTIWESNEFDEVSLDLSSFAGKIIRLAFEFEHNHQKVGGERLFAELAAGEEYYLKVARLDGASSGDYDVKLSSIGPDLVLEDVTVMQVLESELTFRYRVTNVAPLAAAADDAIQILAYLSEDTVLGADDVLLGGDEFFDLAPFETVARTLALGFIPDLSKPYLLLRVDAGASVLEFNELNNVLAVPINGPPADALESNDSFSQAVVVNANPAATISDLSIHYLGDQDFFVFVPPAVGEPTVVAAHFAQYRGRVVLEVYDSQERPISYSVSIEEHQTVLTFIPRIVGPHYIKVSAWESDRTPDYTLVFNSLERPDEYESNDSFAAAVPLPTVRQRTFNIHAANDRDFFAYVPSVSGPHEVRAEFVRSSGDLQLRLYDSSENLIADSNLETDFELVQYEFVQGETYYIEVAGVDGSTSPNYSLNVRGPALPDRFEPNNELTDAVDWGEVAYRDERNLTIDSASDVDFFRFIAGFDGEHVFSLDFDDLRESFDLFLYDSNGNQIASTVRKGWSIDNVKVEALGYYRVDAFPGLSATGLDFGNQSIEGATGVGLGGKISGILFDDKNGNRLRDIDPTTLELEPVLSGFKVFLDLNNDGSPAGEPERTTDQNGYYEFAGLGAGIYNVLYESVVDRQQTYPVRNKLTQLQEVKTGNRPQEVVLAHFNNDEFLDLAVANSEQNNVAVYLNNGEGLFGDPILVPTASGPQGLAEGDLDNDGDLDLVASSLLGARLTILLNDGDGNFNIGPEFLIPRGAFSVAVAQLNDDNNDGRIDDLDFADIIATEKSQFSVSLPALPGGKLHIFFGDVGGSFSDHRIIDVGVDPASVIATHLNDDDGDGEFTSNDRLDLVVANFGDPIPTYKNHAPQPGSVTVLRNDGNRTFSPFSGTGNYTTGNGSYSVESADIDGDNDQDLIVVDGISDGISILRNQGAGTFGAREVIFLGVKATSVTARDLDDDGDLDLAISNGQSDGVVILHNDGLGGFRSLGVLGVADFPKSYSFSVTTGDVDQDGDLDFAVARGLASEVTVLRNEVVIASHRVRVGVNEELPGINFGTRLNGQPPTDLRLSNASIDENLSSANGRVVGNLLVDDPDANDTFRFDFIDGGQDNAKFQLVGNELRVRPETVLNFEAQPTFEVRIRVRDAANQLLVKIFTIAVTDLNDPPVLSDVVDREVDEKVAVTFTLSAADEDLVGGTAEAVTYELVSGIAQGMSLAPNTGAFSWTPSESQDGVHVLVFRAKDSRNVASANQTLTITVRDRNDAPQLSDPADVQHDEGTTVEFTLAAADADITSGAADAVTYHFVSGNLPSMSLNSTTGSFRWPTVEADDGEYVIAFVARDTANTSSVAQTVTITLHEVNQPPTLSNPGNKQVDEGQAVTFTLSATDADVIADVPDVVTYAFVSGNVTGMQLNSATGAFSWSTSEADDGEYVVSFAAKDKTNATSATQSVTIVVREVNQPPTLANPGNKAVDEKETVSFTLLATDADITAGVSDKVTYSIVSGELEGMTLVDQTGVFTWTPTEQQDGGRVVVFVAKDGNNATSQPQSVTITVAEVNQPPVLANPGNRSVVEGATVELTVVATDDDVISDITDSVSYVIVSGKSPAMTFNAGTGVLTWKTTEADDRQHVLVLAATDDSGERSTLQTMTITVEELNQPPELSNPGNLSIDEKGNVAFTLTATDADIVGGAVDSVTYSFVSGNVPGMQLHSATGAFSWLTKESDDGRYTIVFVAKDTSNTSSAPQSVEIVVREVNDPPQLAPVGDQTVDERDTLRFSLTASDTDIVAGVPATISYQFVSGQIPGMTLDGATGALEWTPTAEQIGQHVVVFAAEDNHEVTSSPQTVSITVRDVNDPVLDILLTNRFINELTDTSTGPAFVGTLSGVDIDPSPTHQFEFVDGEGGEDNSRFEIDGRQLSLRQGEVLDIVTKPLYRIRLRVRDGEHSFTKAFEIGITDVNTPPTDISLTTSTIAENTDTAAGAVVVGRLIAADDNQPSSHEFTLVAGEGDSHNGVVVLQGANVAIRQGVSLDHETTPALSIRVQVFDGQQRFDKVLFIAVTDVNEPPTLRLENVVDALPENSDSSTRRKLADLIVTDDKLGQETLRLVGPTASLFELSGTQLFLRAGQTLNFEDTPILSVRIELDDLALGTGAEAHWDYELSVIDVNEPPTLAVKNPLGQIREDADTSERRAVAELVIQDDALGTNVIRVAGPAAAMFEIDANQLFLRSAVELNFEAMPAMVAVVELDDPALPGSPEASVTLTLTVQDVNEPPSLALLNLRTEIAENVSTSQRRKIADLVVSDDASGINIRRLAGADAAFFELDGDAVFLKAGVTLDAETQPFLVAVVEIDDPDLPADPDAAVTFTLTVENINEPPTLSLDNIVSQISEDTKTTTRIRIADIVVADDSIGSTNLKITGTAASSFEIDGNGLFLRAGTLLDFETQPQLSIGIELDDPLLPLNPDDSASLTVTVLNANDPPHEIHWVPVEVSENISGAVLGHLNVDDQDDGQQHTFTASDPRFEVVDGELRLKQGAFLKSEGGKHISFEITATDSGEPARSLQQSFQITVTPNPLPWHNKTLRLDATGDRLIVPLDALVIINQINSGELLSLERKLPESRPFGSTLPFFDTNGDGFCTANDVLNVINFLNDPSGAEGESFKTVQPVVLPNLASPLNRADLIEDIRPLARNRTDGGVIQPATIHSELPPERELRTTDFEQTSIRRRDWENLLDELALDVASRICPS